MNKILATSIVLATLTTSIQSAVANTDNSNETNAVQKVTDTATTQKAFKTTWLGVSLAPVPKVISEQLSNIIPKNQGVMVQTVIANSPAAKAGLQDYDILLSFKHANNVQQLFSAQQLAGLVSASKPNDDIAFSLIRNGSKQNIKVILGESEQFLQHPRMHHSMIENLSRGFFTQQGQSNIWSQPFSQPNLFSQGGFPKMPAMPQTQAQANVMQQFESISIKSLANERFIANVEYQENGGETKKFTFEGKYDELRKQIMEEKELSEAKKNSLLNALKNNPDQLIPDGFMNLPQMPSFGGMLNQQAPMPSWFNNGSQM